MAVDLGLRDILNTGVAGLMLYWFATRLEKRLAKLTRHIRVNSFIIARSHDVSEDEIKDFERAINGESG